MLEPGAGTGGDRPDVGQLWLSVGLMMRGVTTRRESVIRQHHSVMDRLSRANQDTVAIV
jgi:hypothetical protein